MMIMIENDCCQIQEELPDFYTQVASLPALAKRMDNQCGEHQNELNNFSLI